MNLIEVIPLSRGITKEALNYYSAVPIPVGSLIKVPVRKSTKPALVLSCEPAEEQKAKIRRADYTLKKISPKNPRVLFRPKFVSAAQEFAHLHAISTGALLHAVTPTAITSNPPEDELPQTEKSFADIDDGKPRPQAPQPALIQTDFTSRISHYLSEIRRHHKEGRSTIVVCPTVTRIKIMTECLEEKSPTKTYSLYSGRTKKKLREEWKEIIANDEPVLVICTPQYLSLPLLDIGVIIIESQSDTSYTTIGRPHLDGAAFAESLAHAYGIDCLIGDTVTKVETIWRYRQDELRDNFSPKFRYLDPPTTVVDMKENKGSAKGGNVQVFSRQAADVIRAVKEKKQKGILLVARKGFRPFTVCGDCGEILRSPESGYPLVLYEKKTDTPGKQNNERKFVDHITGTQFSAQRTCDECGSWNLNALGIGIDFVANILHQHVPEIDLWQVDSETTSTRTKVQKEVRDFEDSEFGLLLTTELGVRHLQTKVDSAVVVTLDSLLAVPDLEMDHKVFSLITELRMASRERVVIQTRTKNNATLEHAATGNVTAFYREKIAERERFHYPPFSVLIKVSLECKPYETKEGRAELRSLLTELDPDIYPSFKAAKKEKKAVHALITVPKDQWPDETLLQKLRDLPPKYDVDVHPISLL